MNNDQLKQTGLALIAASEGKSWQWMSSMGEWFEPRLEQNYGLRYYLAENYPLRPMPQPAMRAWSKPEDIPGSVCFLRHKHAQPSIILVTGMGPDGVSATTRNLSWDLLASKWEYSTDRLNWKPCTIEA